MVNQVRIFLLLWEKGLVAAQFKLPELKIIEFLQKLFHLEDKFFSKFNFYTVQEN